MERSNRLRDPDWLAEYCDAQATLAIKRALEAIVERQQAMAREHVNPRLVNFLLEQERRSIDELKALEEWISKMDRLLRPQGGQYGMPHSYVRHREALGRVECPRFETIALVSTTPKT